MKSIDFISLLIGILGTALVMVLMGVTHKKGSYQISCGNSCFVLDTNTGKARYLESGPWDGVKWSLPYGQPWDWTPSNAD